MNYKMRFEESWVLSDMKFELCELGKAGIDFIDGDRGKNYPNGTDFSPTGYCLFLNAKNVTSNGFEFADTMFITKEKDSILRKGKLQRHDTVLTTRGTVGNVAYYNQRVPYCAVSTDLHREYYNSACCDELDRHYKSL